MFRCWMLQVWALEEVAVCSLPPLLVVMADLDLLVGRCAWPGRCCNSRLEALQREGYACEEEKGAACCWIRATAGAVVAAAACCFPLICKRGKLTNKSLRS